MVKKDDILRGALFLFQTKGYHATSVEDISQEVGLKKGSLYYHIEGKEQLLFEIHEQLVSHLWHNVKGKIESNPSLRPKEKLKLWIVEHCKAMRDFQPHIQVFFQEMRFLSPANLKIIVEKRKVYENFLKQIIKEGIDVGEFYPTDPGIVTLGILGMVNWMYQWYDSDGRFSAEEIAEIFISLVFQGLVKQNE